jgi:hypothetical protein
LSSLPPACRDCGHEFAPTAPTDLPCPNCGSRRRNLRIEVASAVAVLSVGTPQVWQYSSFARHWYADALREAGTGNDFNARRREIVFAVCFVESYLFEWVRDEALKRDFQQVRDYLPADDRRGIPRRWKEVVKQLGENGSVRATPDFGLPYWEDFQKLIKYRDGLVHASASRPESAGVPDEERPMPPRDDLNTMPPGWPVRIVRELVTRLHATVGTAPPDWLIEP